MVVNKYDRAKSALMSVDAGCSREIWISIGMAAKAADLLFDDLHDWSKAGSNYTNEKDCRDAWESFDKTGGITPATLFGLAYSTGWQEPKTNCGIVNPSAVASQKTIVHKKPEIIHLENEYAREIWNKCLPVSKENKYIDRKQGVTDGLRYYPPDAPELIINGQNVAGYLVVPCWSNGLLQTLQFIPPNAGGKKLNLPGGKFNDGYFTVGSETNTKYLCEGIGQAWAANKVTGHSAIVCFGANRMLTVAKTLRAKYPDSQLIVIPDRGKEKQASEIAKAINGSWVQLPQDKVENYDVNDYLRDCGDNALGSLIKDLKAPETRYKLLSGNDLLNAPPMRWIIRGVLPQTGLAALFGPSGSGKSFLLLDMGFAIAAGELTWFGLRIMKTPVTHVCLEGEAGLAKRINALKKYRSKAIPDELRFIAQPFNLLIDDDVAELARAINLAGGNNGLVIIDTLNRAAPGADENSPKDMGLIIAATKKLQELVGGLVLLVHHTGKDPGKGPRGHSSLFAALDASIEITKTQKQRAWRIAKSKDDATGDFYSFKLDVVNLGNDEYGDAITSCTVKLDGAIYTQEKQKPRGSNQKIALEELTTQFQKLADKERLPITKISLKCDDAVAFVAEKMPVDENHKKYSAKTTISGLMAGGYLDMQGGVLKIL